ncbi:hypothetical protein [Leptospira terpstrae]|uniref:Membrane protein n=1 Tax=Leptospira terpstrae serovar Hualin str. LT 11-33 = ATCC 700639 TaxID=1257025 RepID=N1W2K5_9LEPT|nr:hypothetical protein [Leptospira terpstrae]EMY61881.1 putative membrane protein [Leptospira terpstrae serovar Hualin str. LT 11-33 = ATCC 700639]
MFGKDIYWYGVQAISLLETGKLHSPDHSPVFYIVAFLFQILGISDESLFVFQVLTSVWLLFCLFVARSILFGSLLKQNLSLYSDTISTTALDAKSNLDANSYLATTTIADTKTNPRWYFPLQTFAIPGVIVFVLSFLYPKQSWALGFLLLSISFYFTKLFRWKWIFIGISFSFAIWFHTMVGCLGLGLWMVYQLPKKFYPVLFLLVFFIPLFLPTNLGGRFSIDTQVFPISAAWGIAGMGILWDWFFLVFGKNVPKSFLPIRKTIAFLGLLLALPLFHFADIQYRILLSVLLLKEIFSKTNFKQSLITGVSILLWTYTLYNHSNLFRYPYEQMWDPGEKAALIPNNGLLVAHHGFCEFYHFQFRKDCLSWEPDEKAIAELPNGTKIYRLVYGISYETLQRSKDDSKSPLFTFLEPLGEYQLVLESDWIRYCLWLENKNSKLLTVAKSWKNPYRKRPNFLKRKQTYGI